ncbi:ammonium transporter [Sinanaerobacter chloroacetimidivorans]|uniref:Ammonium transporter n=1 Tax=Sinanaerobacter chloroacetimidivorans TaxID=2818044 RepID=A0A8J7W099_9FIRM|nr:ammonium transporter [Sinanaerobacter chloroacetimidivorans]MBR0598412.1 ammonium transporter [Sinanaerobacter chloroacetimidivorans]
MFSSVDTMWVLIAAALVFFMQAGFAMVETGFTRAKNSANIIMKNLMDFALGSVVFWILGFGLMFGTSLGGIIGIPDFFVLSNYDSAFPTSAFLIFQTVFCATAATIVSGAMAERTKFSAYCIYSLAISAVIYPISGHWIWGGGWLSQLGFHDFAGSTAVHMVGGIAAFVGAAILGPRIGKYNSKGEAQAIPAHNLIIGALGVFILWFGWFGFNGGSTVSATGDDVLVSMSNIFFNTNLAAAAAATGTMIITWIKYKKPDVSMTLNGALGGLVAITAGCDAVNAMGAFAIGLIASLVTVFGIEFIDKKLRIDDPVGAIGVHGLCGAAGTILTGVFALDGGLLYGGGVSMVSVQIIGVVSVGAWIAITMTILFQIIKNTIGLRVTREEEEIGLDVFEHDLVSSYADFMPRLDAVTLEDMKNGNSNGYGNGYSNGYDATAQPIESTLPDDKGKAKISKVEIYANQNKFDELKEALNKIGITGMTVTQVHGCGAQKGRNDYYRGVKLEMKLLPKVCIEVVVSKVPVRKVIETANAVLRTGTVGDGKIFVYDVENVVRVSTGEEGYDALQYDESKR